MKVLHFKTTYLNRSETFIDRLVRNHEEFEPVIAACYKSAYTENLNVYEMPEKGVRGLYNTIKLKLNSSPGFLFDVFEKERPDIVHGHFGLDSYRLIPVINKYNIPFIVNFYGHDVVRLPKEFGWTARYKRLKRYLDFAIAGSDDMKRNLVKLGFDPSKIETIKLAVDVDSIRFQQRSKAKAKIMMVGRLVEKKGFTYVLQAIPMLKDRLPDIQLNIFGDGELMEDLKQETVAHGIERQVNFKGFTDNDGIIDQLYRHDILIVPSVQAKDGDREGIPQTTVEGMATGIPAIASDHAGLPELVKNDHTGLLVPERDPDAIRKSIIKLVENPDLVKNISRNGRKVVEKEHNINTQVRKTEKLYKSLIEKKSL
ncbi:glycosyltransferase [soil metagenome]